MSKVEYHACGGCRKEFYSDEEFYNHPCMKKKGVSNGDPRGLARKALQQGMLKDLTSKGQKQDVLSHIANGGNSDPAVLSGILDANANTDSRLRATQELKKMKHELSAAGIQCNTLNEQQTQQMYQDYVSKQQEPTDNEPSPVSASGTHRVPGRGRKAKKQGI